MMSVIIRLVKKTIAYRIEYENRWIKGNSFIVKSVYAVRAKKKEYVNGLLLCSDDLHRQLTVDRATLRIWDHGVKHSPYHILCASRRAYLLDLDSEIEA